MPVVNPDTMAFLAIRLARRAAALQIYDCTRECWIRIGCTIQRGHVSLYDYGRRVSIVGELPRLVDEGTGKALTFLMCGPAFTVCDDTSALTLTGFVDGHAAMLARGAGPARRYEVDPLPL